MTTLLFKKVLQRNFCNFFKSKLSGKEEEEKNRSKN
jgi:hypothetical protein